MKLSITIPVYNESKRIKETLVKYYEYFNKIYNNEYEIILVNDGSRDDTKQIIEKFIANKKNFKLLNQDNQGKGAAVINGFKNSIGELVGFVDADGSTSPDVFYGLVENIGDADVIVASRWMKDSKINIKQSLARRIASRGFNTLVRLFFDINIRDTQCGCKLFRKDAFDDVVKELGITKWAFDVDLLYNLKRKGYNMKEVSTVWDDKPGSKLNLRVVIPQMFLSIVRLRLVYSPLRFVINAYNSLRGKNVI